MSLRIVESSRASRDVIECYKRIAIDQPDAADRFLNALDDATTGLQLFPLSGHAHETSNPRLTGIRIARIPGFRNHLLFYRVTDDPIDILRILHGARDLDRVLDEPADEP